MPTMKSICICRGEILSDPSLTTNPQIPHQKMESRACNNHLGQRPFFTKIPRTNRSHPSLVAHLKDMPGDPSWEGRCERIGRAPGASPPSNERGLQGVAGNPHQVLIQRWIPPSSPPLEKVGRSETNELLQRLTNLFIPAEMRGWVIPNCRDPPLKARAFCPSQEGDFRRKQ